MWTDWCFNDEFYVLLFHYFILVITDYHFMKRRFMKHLQLFSFCVFAACFLYRTFRYGDEKRPLVKTWFQLHHFTGYGKCLFFSSRISKSLDVTTSSKLHAIHFYRQDSYFCKVQVQI